MATPSNKYDKLLDDIRERDVVDLSVEPEDKPDAYLAVVDDVLWYFSNGNRYKIQATLDNPAAVPFNFIDTTAFEFIDSEPFEFA